MKWMFLPLKRYADFDGRSSRIEYWMFQLFIWVVVFALLAATFMLVDMREVMSESAFGGAAPTDEASPLIGLPLVLIGLFFLGILVPSIAVTVRRLHDRDMSGWFYLITFIPYVGGLILFVFMVLPGTDGENNYGDNPLDEEGHQPDQLEQIFN